MKWHIEKRLIKDLKEYETNPRLLKKKGLSDLEKSIDKFGLAEPLVINTDNTICGGHGRLKILKKKGIKECDCYVPERTLAEEEFKELNIRLNANIAGEWDKSLLMDFEPGMLEDWGLDFTFSNSKFTKQNTEPFKRTHILLSFPPEKFIAIQKYINKIKNIDGIEYEQSSN